jgi:hypothetical protein
MIDGPLRIIHLEDGYYVVGDGYCIAVDTRAEGEQTIEQIVEIKGIE